jgi:hypothetical protein
MHHDGVSVQKGMELHQRQLHVKPILQNVYRFRLRRLLKYALMVFQALRCKVPRGELLQHLQPLKLNPLYVYNE